jgi:hypothetical protein
MEKPKIALFKKANDFRLYSVSSQDFPSDSYILCSDQSRNILYSPHIAGKRLQDSLEGMGELLARMIGENFLSGEEKGKTVELVFMSGGLFYNLNHGFKRTYGFALPQCFMGIQRVRVDGSEGEFTARVGYENFESLLDGANIVIGDTIATGSTLYKGLRWLLTILEEKHYRLNKLVVVTLAGSLKGARRLADMEKKIKFEHPQAKVHFVACEQIFHLMPDGTDLRFAGENAVAPEETALETKKRYGEYLGKNMKCAVFDWGTRCKNPKKHYSEFLEFCEHELRSKGIDEHGKKVLLGMKLEVEKEIEEYEKSY